MPSVICPVVGISQVFSWTSLSGPRVRVLPPLSPTKPTPEEETASKRKGRWRVLVAFLIYLYW